MNGDIHGTETDSQRTDWLPRGKKQRRDGLGLADANYHINSG